MRAGGAPAHFLLGNASAFLLGAALLALPATVPKFVRKHIADLAFIAVLLLLPSLLNHGIDGVRRWIMLGPIRLHPSAIFAPWVVMGAVRAACSRRSGLALGLVAGLQGVHLVQPDAGQSTAVACAVAVASVVQSPARRSVRAGMTALAVLACAATWARSEPLPPVHFVEDAVPAAFSAGLPMGLAAIVALLLLVLGPWVRAWRERSHRPVVPEAALGAYLAASVALVLVGNFPVALLAYGASPVLGVTTAFILLGWLPRTADG